MIVIGMDAATERSGHAAAWAAREAAELGTALSVVDSPDVSSRPLRTLSLDAEFAVIGTRGRAGVPRELATYSPVVFVRSAQPEVSKPELVLGDALSTAARHAHLLVVGGRKKLGHVARELLARGGAPVAVVPTR